MATHAQHSPNRSAPQVVASGGQPQPVVFSHDLVHTTPEPTTSELQVVSAIWGPEMPTGWSFHCTVKVTPQGRQTLAGHACDCKVWAEFSYRPSAVEALPMLAALVRELRATHGPVTAWRAAHQLAAAMIAAATTGVEATL